MLFEIDPTTHDPIRYPAAVVEGAEQAEAARGVLGWLRGPAGRSAFLEAGFLAP
jgi:ABC-type molybdate transport system substrate-binding protein